MWIENFRQFLDRSLQRSGDWVRGLDFLPACLVRRGAVSVDGSLPAPQGLGHGEVAFATDALPKGLYVDLSYRFRSLHCHVRVRILEPTPGMQRIYWVLQESNEA
jgi:hypothetical protein